MHSRCPKCVGKKKMTYLGGVVKDCDACKGVGHINVVLTDEKKDNDAPIIKSVAQRGRPKKVE